MNTATVSAVVAAGSANSGDGDWKIILAAILIIAASVVTMVTIDVVRNRSK